MTDNMANFKIEIMNPKTGTTRTFYSAKEDVVNAIQRVEDETPIGSLPADLDHYGIKVTNRITGELVFSAPADERPYKMQAALDRYNNKWSRSNFKTGDLYRKATNGKTARYGCRLQDHVLALFGHPNCKTIKRMSKEAQAWVDWMTQ